MNPNPNTSGLVPFKKGEDERRGHGVKGMEHSKTRLKRLFSVVVKGNLPTKEGGDGEEQDFTILEIMDAALVKKALKGDIFAYKELMDRFEGKAREEMKQTIIRLGKDLEDETYEGDAGKEDK